MPNQHTVEESTRAAINELLRNDAHLLITDNSERAIANRLGRYLENNFPEWDVDCEYNRNGDAVKRLIYAVEPNGNASERDVIPDIIVHHRGTDENLIAFELKKSTNNQRNGREKDLLKLQAFKEQLGYKYAVFVSLKTGCANPEVTEIHWI
ncbi:TPA: hypothetical protein ACM380_004227 [Escherichia coli]|uniref:Uncharacterized protein n=1 Tax=Escherichia coli TaxID=562 RepID=A0A271U8M9_ECOLX|nr:hypothetical protein [Escherichia coli]EFH9396399.1 hypothetical protein [Escherichia coli]EFI8104812.1 hypothetical protein [Escherichia coli]EFN4639892.1 hypothetical protein [Escherichia coli]EFN5655913.1 hypothetical protein [Escherichia coli]EFO2367488.1 hypothetical protein [Escherichia coli]